MSDLEAELVQNLAGVEQHAAPWPHFTADDFLPASVLADLLACLPTLRLGPRFGDQRQRTDKLPASAASLLRSPAVLDAIGRQWGLTGPLKVLAEVAWFGTVGYPIHSDRQDKKWNGQVYLAGDPKGTELFDEQERLAKVVGWRPNRFAGWLPPGGGKKHAAPASAGRYVLLWWLLGAKS